MTNLFILGNGFDLAHSLHTSWNDFIRSSFSTEWPGNIFRDPDDPEHPWSNLENNLGHPDGDAFIEEAQNDIYKQVLESTDMDDSGPIEPESLLIEDSTNMTPADYTNLRDCLLEWAKNIPIPENMICGLPKNSDSRYITFNYTMTLERLYKVPAAKICHIHGSIDSENIIVGHSPVDCNPRFLEYNGKGFGVESTFNPYISADDEYDQFHEIAEREAWAVIDALEKDTSAGMETLTNFLTSIDVNQIQNVIVMGHSLEAPDQPYFELLSHEIPKADWLIYYREVNSKKELERNLDMIGIQRNKRSWLSTALFNFDIS